MTALILPRRFRNQPAGPVSLRDDLLVYSNSFIIASDDIYGADGKIITYSATKGTYFPPGYGPGGKFLGKDVTNTSVNCYTWQKQIAVGDSFTLIYFGRLDESKTALTSVIQYSNYANISAGDGTNAKFCFAARYDGEGVITAKVTDPTAYTVGKDVCYVFTSRPGVQELWRDGALVATGSSSANLVAASGGPAIFSWPSFYLAGALQRALTSGEAKEISQFPYSVVKPRKFVLYFGGGTPTNYPSAADSGSITLTGSAANGVRSLAGVAASGSITLTGSAANAVRALAGVAAYGSITLTGSNAAALRTWLGVAGAGSITLTGSDAAGVKAGSGAYTSSADAGSITLSGSAAVGTYDRLAAAGSGSITLTGSDASGIRNIPATAEASSIVLTGSAAVGIRTWLAGAEAGALTLTGADAEGVYGGAMTLTPADLDAIAAAVWADPAAVAAHAKLDAIITRITC